MTIALGFVCKDGVLLCADRQMSVGESHKFEANKLFWAKIGNCTVSFAYAGDPDAALVMFRRLREGLRELPPSSKETFVRDRGRAVLEKVFEDKHSEGLQTLIGMSIEDPFQDTSPFLFKTWDSKVVDGYLEYIGSGDSSALRYLCDFLLQDEFTVDEASVLGSYVISVANRYVYGCGGGPDRLVLHDNGIIGEGKGGLFPNERERFAHCENEIGRALRSLLIAGGGKQLDVIDFPVVKLEGIDLDALRALEGRKQHEELLLCNGDRLQKHLLSGEVGHHGQ